MGGKRVSGYLLRPLRSRAEAERDVERARAMLPESVRDLWSREPRRPDPRLEDLEAEAETRRAGRATGG